MAKYNKSIFIFTRDLRTQDNLALIEACKNSETVLPIFIFTPEQTNKNKRFSENCFQFMIESLEDLVKDIPVQFFYGNIDKVINKLLNNKDIEAIYISKDYTKFATKRENLLKKIGLDLHVISNHTLADIESVKQESGKTYSVFTHYRNKFIKIVSVNKPVKNNYKNYYTKIQDGSIKLSKMKKLYTENKNIHINGGRRNGLKILRNAGKFKKYNDTRNFPEYNTTHLSAHNKFGTVSIREVWYAFKNANIKDILDQFIWREFYYCLLYNNQNLLKNNYNEKWNKFTWRNKNFKEWCNGDTGFPIIDAGMRQLNATGFMHNRVRMLVAMFLTKNLMIDWKRGEEYFSKKLVDYDPALNNGNWQWNAGTGIDPLRYGVPRIMNPWSQQKTYDPECIYIKKWIPELKKVPNSDIHNWNNKYASYNTYLEPIIDYKDTIEEFMKEFKKSIR